MKDLNPAVNLIKIPVTDFDRACAFYRDVMGLEEEFAVAQYGWAQYKAGELPICLYVVGMGGGDGKPGNELNFHLAVNNVKQAFELVKKGAKNVGELTASDDGGSFFMLTDPDGNRFKIVQRA